MSKNKKQASKKQITRSKKIPKSANKKSSFWHKYHPGAFMAIEVWNFILATLAFFVAVFLVAAYFSHGGPVGDALAQGGVFLLGWGYWLVPMLLGLLAYNSIKQSKRALGGVQMVTSLLFLIAGLGMVELLFRQGGWVGQMVAHLEQPIGYYMAFLLLALVFVGSIVVMFDAIPFISKREHKTTNNEKHETPKQREVLSKEESKRIKQATQNQAANPGTNTGEKSGRTSIVTAEKDTKAPVSTPRLESSLNKKIQERFASINKQEAENTGEISRFSEMVPPLNLLAKDKGQPEVGDITSSANIIKRTLVHFGIEVEMGEVEVGPTVTRYAFKPAEGVKLARIAGLKDDLALALAAKTLRMETPIPGKSLVGIEVPNKNSTMVGFGSLLAHPGFNTSKFELPLALGKNIAGEPAFINMAKAPHILVAGTTGAGKSVTVHSLIASMLYKYGPDMLKFIMVDPKRVEMTLYNGIPHLLTPVITDAKTVIVALRWAIKEMERRLEILEQNGVRDIGSYHKNIVQKHDYKTDEEGPEKMPYIVIVIDELADIMQAYPKELEAGIVTLAQKSRAAGIHLIISTQRPSVNVITGTIKANVPTRLALQVASAIDSRTILDMGGAEQLLGKGDMLYMTGDMSKPIRVQCAYLSEEEVKKIVVWLKKTYKEEVPQEIDLSAKAVSENNVMFAGSIDQDDDNEDDLYEDARQAVIEAGKASTSYLQRRLRVGYSRAARLIDILEEKGVIGPADGAKPREVLEQHTPQDEE